VGGINSVCIQEYADCLETIPYTLAQNAGLKAIEVVTDLRNRHAEGAPNAGVNVRKGEISDMIEEKVVQPLLVSHSAMSLATESCIMILKIDDIVPAR